MKNQSGFTLLELIIAMAISLIVLGGVYSVYYSQQKSYATQEQVAVMQQNLRGAMITLTKDIRMAGYDPEGILPDPTILEAGVTGFKFYSVDDSGTTPTADTIRYYYDPDDKELQRDNNGNIQPIAENIESIEFVYLDMNGIETANMANLRSVQVTLTARARKEDKGYVDPDYGDGYRRRVLSRQIKCRNLGL